jgi:hypothetical protein
MPRKKDITKMTMFEKVEKFCQISDKYKLKSLEVSENVFKIEFSDHSVVRRTPKLTKEQKEGIITDKTQQLMDELQLTDPEMYEEMLVLKAGGLKELS